ncbi:MAG: RIP metalloprotease RseP [Parcubacteria group bacterium]|nr:MAG: RIP metalloprotease RseP [Parcubacteria group bacterium]
MITTIIAFVIILGVLVLVHEYGHFISARKLGVDVEEFGVGFPPRLWSYKRNGIIYSLNLIPIGGFVKIRGENGEDEDPRSFASQPTWRKSIIISAGVIMNLLLAIVLLTVVFYAGIPQILSRDTDLNQVKNHEVIIADVVSGSPANLVGIAVGDRVLEISGQKIVQADQVNKLVEQSVSTGVIVKVVRNRVIKEYSVVGKVLEPGSLPRIGIGVADTGVVHYNILESIGQGFAATYQMSGMILEALYNLVKNLITRGQLDAGLSGPVGVAVITGQIVRLGFIHVLQFMAILSINLGILNILPFPALDGGRLLFIIIEKLRGKKNNAAVEGWIHNSGFILLIFLLIFITFRDIGRYGSQILSSLKSLF